MSADNYYMIRRHPAGGFCAIECCASDDTEPAARPDMRSWPTVDEAFDYAEMQYSEYGTRIHKECREVQTPTLFHVGDKVDTYEGVGTVLAIIQWIEYRVQVNEDGNHPWIGTFSEEDLTLLGPDPVTLLEQARIALLKLAAAYAENTLLPPPEDVQETIIALTKAIPPTGSGGGTAAKRSPVPGHRRTSNIQN